MIVDSSALVSILRDEPEAVQMLDALAAADRAKLSAGTWVELGAVTSNGGPGIDAKLGRLMAAFSIAVEPVDHEQARIGHDVYRRYGKGHHQARLNLGDCFTYALAKATGEPLLFKGKDFGRTDLILAEGSAYPR